ncbi:hypothetical protein Rcae01_02686 [Novipirellula caenicola]|uniref:Uncharacterized protein n=1 Tax=Novipirellula caenicola TaxID=1536901 RepID=A0ABP9VRF1_9BACT
MLRNVGVELATQPRFSEPSRLPPRPTVLRLKASDGVILHQIHHGHHLAFIGVKLNANEP